MVSDVQRTHGSKGLFELLDNNYPHGGIQNTMQNDAENSMSWRKVMTRGTTAMLKIRELRPKKLSFQTSNDSMI